jgi:hypothetical protein
LGSDLLIEILFGLQICLLDQGQFLDVFTLLSVHIVGEGLAHVFNEIHDALILCCLDSSDQENDRELISKNLFTKDLNELLVKIGSVAVDVVQIHRQNLGIGLGHNGDEEVHKANEENDDVNNIEDRPNKVNHSCGKNSILLTITHSCCPIRVFRNSNITDGVSCGLHQVNIESADFLVIAIVECSSDQFVEGRDTENEDEEECQETKDVSETSSNEDNLATDRLEHFQDGEHFDRGNNER